MAILSFRTSTYARNIYMLGTERFTARDEFTGIPEEYVVPVMQYAAGHYTINDLNNALAQGWINQEEYNQTLTYV